MRHLIAIAAAVALVALPGCTTATVIRQPGGHNGFDIACGAGLGWGVCYDRANEVCPAGYNVVSKDDGFNRKEMVIDCPPAYARVQ